MMQLNLEDLKSIANEAAREVKLFHHLKKEFQNELGYRAVGKTLHALAVNVNDALDERIITGQSDYIEIKRSVLIECLKHSSDEVRRLAARLLPENLADQVIFLDENDEVIYAAAGRASPGALAKLLEQNRHDELLFDIARSRLNEDIDLERSKRLQKVVDAGPTVDIGNFWYVATAKRLIEQYMHKIDSPSWVTALAKKTAANMRSMSGVEIDEKKLRDEIVNQIKAIDDEKMNESISIESSLVFEDMIKNLGQTEILTENFIVSDINESEYDELFEVSSKTEYIPLFESMFKVRYYDVQRSLLVKNLIDESMVTSRNTIRIPGTAYTPHMRAPTEFDERVLDKYVSNWNDRMMSKISEGLELKWSMNAEHEGKISFNIGVK